ncbi:MAG: hypothetical protein AAF614_05760 [Chloroflexota bacterium]
MSKTTLMVANMPPKEGCVKGKRPFLKRLVRSRLMWWRGNRDGNGRLYQKNLLI